MNNLDKLQELLQGDINRLDGESKKHKRIHRTGQSIVIVLTAITTVVAGAGLILQNRDRVIQFCVLCLAATTTAVTAWTEMRRARELWQHEREMYYALLDIQREINFYVTYKDLNSSEIEAYFQRISAVLGASVHKWARIQEKKTA